MDGSEKQTLDYQNPRTAADPGPPVSRVAYYLLAAPFAEMMLALCGYGGPAGVVIFGSVGIGVAIGASVYILRRRPRSVAGWLSLVVWGLAVLQAILHFFGIA